MGVRVTDWRCSKCGEPLAGAVELRRGWIERKCRKCGTVDHIGDARGAEEATDLRCSLAKPHKLAEAAADWQGRVVIACDRCHDNSVHTHVSS